MPVSIIGEQPRILQTCVMGWYFQLRSYDVLKLIHKQRTLDGDQLLNTTRSVEHLKGEYLSNIRIGHPHEYIYITWRIELSGVNPIHN